MCVLHTKHMLFVRPSKCSPIGLKICEELSVVSSLVSFRVWEQRLTNAGHLQEPELHAAAREGACEQVLALSWTVILFTAQVGVTVQYVIWCAVCLWLLWALLIHVLPTRIELQHREPDRQFGTVCQHGPNSYGGCLSGFKRMTLC